MRLPPYRNALVEMNMTPEFQEAHHHKDSRHEEFTIVAASFPQPDTIDRSLIDTDTTPDRLMLLQVVADADRAGHRHPLARSRIGTFTIEDDGDRRRP